MSEEERLEKRRIKREAKVGRRRLRREPRPSGEAEMGGEVLEGLPEGARGDGMHDVGPINERARHNRGKAKRAGDKALRHEEEAEIVQERLDGEGTGTEDVERRLEGLKLSGVRKVEQGI